MSDHEDKLINPSQDTSPKMDVQEGGDVLTRQPLEPTIITQSSAARPTLPEATLPKDLESDSDSANSKAAHASGSVQSLPSLESLPSVQTPSIQSRISSISPSPTHSWHGSISERSSWDDGARLRLNLRQGIEGEPSIPSMPTSIPSMPAQSPVYSPAQSHLSSHSQIPSLPRSTSVDLTAASVASTPTQSVESEANPYMRRTIWVMTVVAIAVVGVGVILALRSVYNNPDTPVVIEAALPSDPSEVMDLDLNMGV